MGPEQPPPLPGRSAKALFQRKSQLSDLSTCSVIAPDGVPGCLSKQKLTDDITVLHEGNVHYMKVKFIVGNWTEIALQSTSPETLKL